MNLSDTKVSICVWPVLSLDEDINRVLSYLCWHGAAYSDAVSIRLSAAGQNNRDLPKFIINLSPGQLNPDDADHIIFWTREAFERAPRRWRKKGVSLDPYVDIAVSEDYDRFFAQFGDFAFPEPPFKKPGSEPRDSIIIGTSAQAKSDLDKLRLQTENPLCIFIGSAILNAELRQQFSPNWVILADGPSQLGSLQSAEIYRDKLFDVLDTHTQINILLPAHNSSPVRQFWPGRFHNRIYSVKENPSAPLTTELVGNGEFLPTGNVLTGLAIPLAAQLSSQIFLAGVSTQPHANAFGQYEGAERQKRLASLLFDEPGSLASRIDYHDRHYTQLFELSKLYDAAGISLLNAEATPLVNMERNKQSSDLSPLTKALQFGAKFPALFLILFWASVMAFTFVSKSIFGDSEMIYILTSLALALVVLAVLFLRSRQNRLFARLEHRLSKQSAAQFENLSKRLQDIEAKTVQKKQ